ncbi:uncharacterized protein LOC111447205 [Cucurbita moschata]|uniref:Uncharacterized protein LOC111447205 n=1 Tax=Cucurbita moschata TaxID=3662 RepID=A0A6J1FP22_CUCMO|nr:uncharacterized protein LOC111447205 [Cucurbita moschata]
MAQLNSHPPFLLPLMTLLLSKSLPVFSLLGLSLSSSFAPFAAVLSGSKSWSAGVKKSLKEEAMESLKAISTGPIQSKSKPSPVQAFLGAIAAGVIALILYKFTTTIEAALNRQTVSDNFSVRQLTITIRTIVNGICYLATFVFGINAVGLFLYSGQLALNSVMEEGSEDKELATKGDKQVSSPNSTVETTLDGTESSSSKDDQS